MATDTSFDTGLVQAVEKLRPLIAEHATAADTSRSLPAEVIAGLKEAGFTRHFVPERWGGLQAGFSEVTQAVALVGQECANAAWCASLSAYAGRFGAFLPEQGQGEIWANGPDAFIVAALVPAGSAEEVDHGWHIKGKWTYVSGIEFADWALLCGPAPTQEHPEAKFFAVPRESCRIIPTWDSAGLRATTSHTIEVDAMVPHYLTFPRMALLSGRGSPSQASCHNIGVRAVGGLAFLPPALGAAEGALQAAVDLLSGKRHHPDSATTLVRASAQIDAARLLVERIAAVADAGTLTEALTARNERDVAVAGELLNEAVSSLVRACGTSGLAEGKPLQRYWRDVTAATSHVALRLETAAVKFYSAVLLGTPAGPPAGGPPR